MDIKLIGTGVMGLILMWATWSLNIYASAFAGILGIIYLILGLKD